MRGQSRARTTARRALWFSVLLVLLAGIFGMHGLSSHAGGVASEGHPSPSHESVAAQSVVAPPAGVRGVASRGGHDLAHTAVTMRAVLVEGLPGRDMGMSATCVAVLALALTVLLRVLGDAPALPLYRRLSALTRALIPPPGRDPDPPSLIVLSIRRC